MEERRRIQLVGGTTYAVTLPKRWAERLGLRPGTEVTLRLQPDGSIVIRKPDTPASMGEAVIEVEAGSTCPKLIREVIVRYVMGFETLRLVFPEQSPLQLKNCLMDFVSSRMIGVEVIEEYSDTVILQCFTPPDMVSVNKVLGRMSRTAIHMLKDAINGVVEGNMGLLEDVVRRDDVVDKFYLYLLKQLGGVLSGRIDPKQVGISSAMEAPFLMIAAKYVERVGDYSELISRTWLSSGSIVARDVVSKLAELAHPVSEVLERAVSSLLNPGNTEEIHGIIDYSLALRARLREKGSKVLAETGNPEAIVPVKTLVDSLTRVTEYAADIAEAALHIASIRSLTEA